MSTPDRIQDDRGEVVVVTRQPGDWRKIGVPRRALTGLHTTSITGGVKIPTATPRLAAYMLCDQIPEGAEFGHSCEHGPGPHRIKVIIQKADNAAALYRSLVATAR